MKQYSIIGILNCTPDSFSDGGCYLKETAFLERARYLVDSGADYLEIGAESTRPGAKAVPADEQLRRLIPAIALLKREFPDYPLALDSSSSRVIKYGLSEGVALFNDVRAFPDEEILKQISQDTCKICIVHMQGEPETMQKKPYYSDFLGELKEFFACQLARCKAHGIAQERIICDPGIGFGKKIAHHQTLFARLEELLSVHPHWMFGCSRKSFLGDIYQCNVGDISLEKRDFLTAIANTCAFQKGVSWFRVHDVKVSDDALRVAQYFRNPSREERLYAY